MQQRETRETIHKLRDSGEPVEEASLVHLSNLTREEQAWLDESWAAIPLDKRRRLVVLLGEQAEEEGHHPALLTEWGKVTVTWWTHKIGGLHRNDFIMAARTDETFGG